MAIDVRGVSKRYGRTVALDNVDLDVRAGSLTALLGPSGGGKSTLLRVIAGLERPDAGTVIIDGADATHVAPRYRGIGFCFQHYAPFRHMTVWQNIAFGLEVRHRPKREIRERVMRLIELVRLEGFANRYPSQLSGGQRQRMALARALAVEPRVLLLDEPFGALDAQVRKELRVWLRRLHEEVPITTVLVTHDQEEAMEIADHLAIVHNGRIEQVGTPGELYDSPASQFVLTFLGPATSIGGRWVRPHDIGVSREQSPGATGAKVLRVTSLGFEVRVEFEIGGEGSWAQLARPSAAALGLSPGDEVWLTLPPPTAVATPATTATPATPGSPEEN
jgi:sulfate transport system ATP-binding protein